MRAIIYFEHGAEIFGLLADQLGEQFVITVLLAGSDEHHTIGEPAA